MPTKHSSQAQTGASGVDFVRNVVTAAGSIYRPFDTADLGIDGTIEFINSNREPTGDMVLVQIKAGASFVHGNRFVLPGDRDHFETWSRYPLPVVGVVVDPASQARWVDISAHIRRNPETMVEGPYTIEVPATQVLDAASFAGFAAHFTRPSVGVSGVATTPNFLIREWRVEDAKPTRVLLRPIADDYPGFDEWLSKQWPKTVVSKKVVELDRVVAAYSMWTRKDERNIKLQTFIVGQLFRGTAIGQHLLYHELRTWAADPKITRVFVTVASSKVDLIDYFGQFGFRVEGMSANRYPRESGAAELVMAKHFVREVVRTPEDLERVVGGVARRIWGIGSVGPKATRFDISAVRCSVPTTYEPVSVALDLAETTASPRVRILSETGDELASHDDASLMRDFYPLRLRLKGKRYLIVPIYAQWARAMLATTSDAQTSRPTSLKLRVDNVYYCYPKASGIRAGDLVIFYEPARGGGSKAAIGAATIREAVLDSPEALHARFASRGVYRLQDVRRHVRKSDGRALAIHFEMFEPFESPVGLAELRNILRNNTNVQGLTRVTRDQFERLCDRGLE